MLEGYGLCPSYYLAVSLSPKIGSDPGLSQLLAPEAFRTELLECMWSCLAWCHCVAAFLVLRSSFVICALKKRRKKRSELGVFCLLCSVDVPVNRFIRTGCSFLLSVCS